MTYISIILSFFKLVFSSGFKESLANAIERIKSSEDWSKDLLLFKGKFKNFEENRTEVLLGKINQALREKYWDEESINNVNLIYRELATNGLTHGIKDKSYGILEIEIELCSNYVQMQFKDNGEGFDLNQKLIDQKAFFNFNDTINGLNIVFRLSAEFRQYHDGTKNVVFVLTRNNQKPIEIIKKSNYLTLIFDGYLELTNSEIIHKLSLVSSLELDKHLLIIFKKKTQIARTAKYKEVVKVINKRNENIESLNKNTKIAFIGVENLDTIIRSHLQSNFRTFLSEDEALEYFKG